MNIFQKVVKHFILINKHKWCVFKLAVKAGIPFRGLVHDLSKFSPTEFFESVKYYNGKRSPIVYCLEDKGYSLAWLHHKGRNKHHLEYWEDCYKGQRISVYIPYKYMVELICDRIAAGMVYGKDNWNENQPLEYWNKYQKNNILYIHPSTCKFIETVFIHLAETGLDNTINPKYLKKLYKDILEEEKIN